MSLSRLKLTSWLCGATAALLVSSSLWPREDSFSALKISFIIWKKLKRSAADYLTVSWSLLCNILKVNCSEFAKTAVEEQFSSLAYVAGVKNRITFHVFIRTFVRDRAEDSFSGLFHHTVGIACERIVRLDPSTWRPLSKQFSVQCEMFGTDDKNTSPCEICPVRTNES